MRKLTKVTKCKINARGITLIELMIVVAIAGILVSAAVPVYSDYLEKSRRADAVNLLLEAATKHNVFFSENGSYGNMKSIGYSADPIVSPGGFYSISIVRLNADSHYTMTATRNNSQTSDAECGDLTLNNFGVKSAVNASDSEPSKNCW